MTIIAELVKLVAGIAVLGFGFNILDKGVEGFILGLSLIVLACYIGSKLDL